MGTWGSWVAVENRYPLSGNLIMMTATVFLTCVSAHNLKLFQIQHVAAWMLFHRYTVKKLLYVTSDSPHSNRTFIKTTGQMELISLSFWSVSLLRGTIIIGDKAFSSSTCAGVHMCYGSKPSTRRSWTSVTPAGGLLPLPLCNSQQCCCRPAGFTPNLLFSNLAVKAANNFTLLVVLRFNCQTGLGWCEKHVTNILCDFLKRIGSLSDNKSPEWSPEYRPVFSSKMFVR